MGFAYQVAFVRVLGRFLQQAPLEIDEEILRFAALQLGADAETIHAYAGRQQTVSEHQQRIGQYLRLRAFDAAAGERLMQFLEAEALRLERTASLLARARAWPRDEHVLAPADSVLRRAIGAARHKARTLLTQRMAARLSAPMRDRLDPLIAVDNDQPHSPLHRIKASSSNPSVGGMKRLLARLELILALWRAATGSPLRVVSLAGCESSSSVLLLRSAGAIEPQCAPPSRDMCDPAARRQAGNDQAF